MDVRINEFRSIQFYFSYNRKKNKIALFIFPDSNIGGILSERVRDEIEKHLEITDITAADFQDEIIAPIIIEEYREQVTKRMKDEEYMHILALYIRYTFQDFESFLRTEIDLVEDDYRLVLNEYI